MKPKFRRINTGLYSDVAYETLMLLQLYPYFYCFSDRSDRAEVFRKFFIVKRDSDNQVYIEISKEQRYNVGSSLNNRFFNMPNPFLKKSNTEVLKFLAKKLKVATQYDAKRRASRNNLDIDEWTKWSADNKNCIFSPAEYSTFNLSLTCHITMSDVYLICKELTGRKTELRDKIVGKALTIEEINEIANAKHISEMKDKYIHEYHIQQRKLFETYRQKLKDEYDNLRKEFIDKLHTIDPMCNANVML
jgi:hypothetical protein